MARDRMDRWNWMTGQLNRLRLSKRFQVVEIYHSKHDKPTPDRALYEAFMEAGVALKGTDPMPDPYVSICAGGVEEYEQAMAADDLMKP